MWLRAAEYAILVRVLGNLPALFGEYVARVVSAGDEI